jgi:hypothetical protein
MMQNSGHAGSSRERAEIKQELKGALNFVFIPIVSVFINRRYKSILAEIIHNIVCTPACKDLSTLLIHVS